MHPNLLSLHLDTFGFTIEMLRQGGNTVNILQLISISGIRQSKIIKWVTLGLNGGLFDWLLFSYSSLSLYTLPDGLNNFCILEFEYQLK
jgi:hypothetical protein